MKWNPINNLVLYNTLNDMRHLVIIDLRPKEEYYVNFLRNSYLLLFNEKEEIDEKDLLLYIKKMDENAISFETKYKYIKIRRLVVIKDNNNENKSKILNNFLKNFNFNKNFEIDDKFLINFKLSYSFFIISFEDFDKFKNNTIDEINKQISMKKQMDILYSNSNFPFLILENELFLGSIININSKKQLNDLKIKNVIIFKNDKNLDYQRIEKNNNEINIDINLEKIINFNEINLFLSELEKPIILSCKDHRISSAFAIIYLMYFKKLQSNISSLKIFSIMGNTIVNRTLYNQVLNYNPNEDIIKV